MGSSSGQSTELRLVLYFSILIIVSILCLGRNRRNQELLSQVLAKAGYSVKVVLTMEELMPTVEQGDIALVLLDITGFDARVWQFCQELRSHAIPFFIISPPQTAHLPAQYGSDSPLLVKPLAIRSLLTLIARTLPHHE